MVNESVIQSLVRSLDDPVTATAAVNALDTKLQQSGDAAPALAATIALAAPSLNTKNGKQHALNILVGHSPKVPECVNMALDLSHDEDTSVRTSAVSFLKTVVPNVKAEKRIFELLDDPDPNVRIAAISALETVDIGSGSTGTTDAMYVIRDAAQRGEAMDLLERLERAVKTLQDVGGLSDGQNEIVDKMILPDIERLRKLFSTESRDLDEVIAGRKHSLITLSGVARTAQAFALGTTGVANADKAAATVMETVRSVSPLLDSIQDLL